MASTDPYRGRRWRQPGFDNHFRSTEPADRKVFGEFKQGGAALRKPTPQNYPASMKSIDPKIPVGRYDVNDRFLRGQNSETGGHPQFDARGKTPSREIKGDLTFKKLMHASTKAIG